MLNSYSKEQGFDDETYECRGHPEGCRRPLDGLDKNLAHQCDQHRNAGQHRQSQTDRPRGFAGLLVVRVAEDLTVCPE